MSTYLYKKEGGTVLVKDARKVSDMIASGEFYADEQGAVPTSAPTKDEADTNHTGKLSSPEVRAAAKKAGFPDYQTARINKLKVRLGYND